MAKYTERREEDFRDQDNNYGNRKNRSQRSGSNYDQDSNRGYSNYGSSYDNSRRNEEDWRSRGNAGGNFSGSNEDRDFDFGMNRRGRGNADFGEYTNRDNVNSPLGVRSNYAYNRAGYGSNFGGEYGHYGRRDSGYGNESGRQGYGREQGWAWGNPDTREYSSYSGRTDKEQDERWKRDNYDWMDRAGDTVKSWFGDDDAEHRLRGDSWRKRQEATYRGMGPKNYQRTDARIEEDVNDRLSDDSWVDASDIEVKVEHGEVVLTGTVQDKNAKRRAEDIADTVYGVKNVENRIKVNRSYPTPGDPNTWR